MLITNPRRSLNVVFEQKWNYVVPPQNTAAFGVTNTDYAKEVWTLESIDTLVQFVCLVLLLWV